MNEANIIIESSREHLACVYALTASVVFQKSDDSFYRIMICAENGQETFLKDLLTLQNEQTEIVLLPKKKPLNYEGKVLYLNWNTLAAGDLTDLMTVELEDCCAAAVKDRPNPETGFGKRERYDESVIVTYLAKEDSLSGVKDRLGGKIKELPEFYSLEISEERYGSAMEYARSRAVIFRLSPENLPEQYFDHPLSELWMKYYKLSPRGDIALRRKTYTESSGSPPGYADKSCIPIVIPLRDEETEYAAALLESIEGNTERALDVMILYRKLSERSRRRLLEVPLGKMYLSLFCIQDYSKEGGYRFPELWAVQAAADYRRAVCLAPKAICCCDIGQLYDMETDGIYIRAAGRAVETENEDERIAAETALLNHETCIDTNVMLLNIDAWIQEGVSDRIRGFIKTGNRFSGSMQKACAGKVGQLSNCWNYRGDMDEKSPDKKIFTGEHRYRNERYIYQIDEKKHAVAGKGKEETMKELLGKVQDLEKERKEHLDRIAYLEKQNEILRGEKEQFLYELLETRKSITYKIGRFMTFIPRKIRRVK